MRSNFLERRQEAANRTSSAEEAVEAAGQMCLWEEERTSTLIQKQKANLEGFLQAWRDAHISCIHFSFPPSAAFEAATSGRYNKPRIAEALLPTQNHILWKRKRLFSLFWNEENGSILHPVFLRFSLRFNNTRELWRIGGNCTQKTKCLDSFTSSEAEDAKASPRLSWLDVFPRKTCANLDSFARARVFGLCSEEQTLYGLQLNSRQENSEFACFQRFSHWGPFQHEILLPFWHSLYPP